MTAKEIITALRCTAIVDRHEDCAGCPYHVVEQVPGEDMESFGTETWESCDVDLSTAAIISHSRLCVEQS